MVTKKEPLLSASIYPALSSEEPWRYHPGGWHERVVKKGFWEQRWVFHHALYQVKKLVFLIDHHKESFFLNPYVEQMGLNLQCSQAAVNKVTAYLTSSCLQR